MSETFVDLMYRGLALGRRIKLTQVRPSNGYLEHPTPMPIGTAVAISTDDGLVLDAVVTGVHEQVGGSDVAPGMRVTPALASEKLTTWWKARVTLPEVDPVPAARAKPPTAPPAAAPMTVRPRSHTIPEPVPANAPTVPTEKVPSGSGQIEPAADPTAPTAVAATAVDTTIETPAIGGGAKTKMMPAIDQEMLEQLTRNPDEAEKINSRSGEYAVIDDGQRTTVMSAVDPSALGLDLPMGDDDVEDDTSAADSSPIPSQAGDDKKPANKNVKKRKKKR
jgi:hypothetical protein